ncbi:MAG: folate-binding protein [Gammaproteobacteria bacterium]|nr:folate-binding protein [Gammaproteobacteria bacterium]
MQTQWQQFLLTQGAQLDAREHIAFSNMQDALNRLDGDGILCSLDHLGCIRASGEDVQAFLQGQLSNDITQLHNTHVQLSAYCNPKGRMLAQFLVVPAQQDYLLLLPRAILEPTLKRLRMFVMRSKVTLSDVSAEMVCLGIAGPAAAAGLQPDLAVPADDYALTQTDSVLCCRLPGKHSRYLLVTNFEQAKSLWQQHAAQWLATDQHAWHWLDIQAGLPSIWPETVEEFVPQMVNLELINGVNFKKGCYPGQEIVARMHYLGKPKRRMHHLVLDQAIAPAPGTDIYVATGDGQSAGKVVLAEASDRQCECLAVLQNDKLETELRLGALDGPRLTLASLPYSLETA